MMKIRIKKKKRYTRDILKAENFKIGEYTYGTPKVYAIWQGAKLKIGKFCSIAGEDVEIFLGDNHRTDWVSTYPFPVFLDEWPEAGSISGYYATRGDVIIGNDVWIGHRVMILSGVRIGDGAVVGARSVVARDVAPYSVVVGNPAVLVRKRFDDETIAKLLQIQWWNWPIQKIRENIPKLNSGEVDGFVRANG